MLRKQREEFKATWGEDVFNDRVLSVADGANICEYNFERYGSVKDRLLFEKS